MIDALYISKICEELKAKLSGGRIDKINMPAGEEIILSIRANGENYRLLISASANDARLHLTTNSKENPLVAPAFLMHLRKHIGGGIITSIDSIPFERVAVISISAKNELLEQCEFKLYAEIMGKYSNIILVDEKGNISDSIKRVGVDVSGKRQVFPSLKYLSPPPQEGKFPPNKKEKVISALEDFNGGKIDGFLLCRIFGLAPASIREAIFCAVGKLAKDKLTEAEMEKIAIELCRLYEREVSPCALIREGKPHDFYIYPYRSLDADFTFYNSLSEAADDCTLERSRAARFNEKAKILLTALKSKISRLEKRLAYAIENENNASDYKKNKEFGDLILSNIFRLKKGEKVLKCDNFFQNSESVEIPLDIRLNPQENAGSYFKRYNKQKRTLQYAEKDIANINSELEYLYTVRESFNICDRENELIEIAEELASIGLTANNKQKKNKQKQFSPSLPTHITVKNFDIYSGKNNAQNERLTLQSAAPDDMFFHARNAAGSHVIVVTKGRMLPDDVLLAAACLAAKNSKLRNMPKAAVDYCAVKYVRKPKGSPLGTVTYTNSKTILVEPL